MDKSYGTNIDFCEEKLPYIQFTDDQEILFINRIDEICNELNQEFGEGNVVISGSLAMFLNGIRLRKHQNESDVDILLLNDSLKKFDSENPYKFQYRDFLFDRLKIYSNLDVLTQKIFLRNFYCYNTFDFNSIKIKVETPESLLKYETLALGKGLGKEKFHQDISIISQWITTKNDNECLSIINALDEIFGNLNIQYAIAGSYSLWMQGVQLQREFGHDVDIILLCDKNEEIIKNIIQNENLKKILYRYGIHKDIDFVDKHPIIDDNFLKINFKGKEVYTSTIHNLIKTKLRYLKEQKSKNNVIKSKFDLECLSDLPEYKFIIINYKLLSDFNEINNQINDAINLGIEDQDFYLNIQSQINTINSQLINKIDNE